MPADTHDVRIIRHADLAVSPWANHAGITRQVAASPEGAGVDSFEWRISIADVVGACSFSSFPGIDRTLLLVEGSGMVLAIDGVTHRLERCVPLCFGGEADVACTVPDGPTRDLNIMCRRGQWSAAVEVLDARTPLALAPSARGVTLVGCFAGRWSMAQPTADELEPGDFLRLGGPAMVQADGPVVRIRLTPGHERLVEAVDGDAAAE